MRVKCLIIGSGPAGYTAAIYAARANLAPVLIEGPQLGGQLTTTTEVENFPGYPDGVEPFTMMDDMRRQAERFGTTFVSGIVTKVDFSTSPKKVIVEDDIEYEADAVIVATGASAKYLGIESERTYRGRGVSACATCDGFFYRKKTVAVVGGGDTACEEANYLAGLCEKVYMIVRKPYLRASEIMQQRVLNNPKIEVLFEHNTLQLTGEGKVQGADLVYRKGEPDEELRHIDIDGFFLAPGATAEWWLRCIPTTSRATVRERTSRASLLPVTAPTPITVRPSWRPDRVPKRPSKQTSILKACKQQKSNQY